MLDKIKRRVEEWFGFGSTIKQEKSMQSLFFMYPDTFLWHQTNNLALRNLCEKYQLNYKPCVYRNNYKSQLFELSQDENCTIACFETNPDYNMKDYKIIKEKLPNAKIIFFGSDSIYLGSQYGIEWPIFLLIDTMSTVIRNKRDYEAEHYYWTVSETILKDIQATKLDAIVKDKAFVSLCKKASGERTRFFNDLSVNSLKVHWNLDLWNLPDIYRMVASAKFALGHTTPVHDNKARSTKGFRDWIAPECGTVLIYDDHEDMRAIGPDILPLYRYLDAGQVVNLVRMFDDTPGMYEKYLVTQQKWAWDNTIERQLERIFKKYELI